MNVVFYRIWPARWSIGPALGGSMEHRAGSMRR
jgi:hypothetical protein